MTLKEEEIQKLKDELQWIDINEYSRKRNRTLNLFDILLPIGCIVTAGILGRGLYHMTKQNARAQQKMMRYRVLSQGITIILAAIGLFKMKAAK